MAGDLRELRILASKGSSDNAPWDPCLHFAKDFSVAGHVLILCMSVSLGHVNLGSSGHLSHSKGTISLFGLIPIILGLTLFPELHSNSPQQLCEVYRSWTAFLSQVLGRLSD